MTLDLPLLLDYHYWARDRMLAAASRLTPEQYTRDLGASFSSVQGTLVHTYSAEWAWHARWTGVSPTAPLAPDRFPDVPALDAAWRAHEVKMRAFLEAQTAIGLDQEFDYHFLSGQPARSVFWHMLQHVVNHASYHRGQVTTLLRQMGAAPPQSMDLIAFYRERAGR